VPYQLDSNWTEQYENLIKRVIADRFVKYRDKEDLLQEGFIAVIAAAERFDPEKQMKFTTYAYQRIYWRLLRFIQQNALDYSQLSTGTGKGSSVGHRDWLESYVPCPHLLSFMPEGMGKEFIDPLIGIAFRRLPERERKAILLRLDWEKLYRDWRAVTMQQRDGKKIFPQECALVSGTATVTRRAWRICP